MFSVIGQCRVLRYYPSRTSSSFRLISRELHDAFSFVNSLDNDACSDIAQGLNERGFGTTKSPLLSLDACSILHHKFPALFRGEFETGQYPDEWHWRQGMSLPHCTREICNAWKCDRFLASIVLSERIGQMVARITGWSSVRIAQDDVIWKPPNEAHTMIGFHQDATYISDQFTPRDNNSVTVWMALDHVMKDMGGVEYAVGSHLWKEDEALQLQESSFHDCDGDTYRNSVPRDDANIEYVSIPQGHAIVHHQSVWHGSGPNRSKTHHRRALVGHYLRGDVEFNSDERTGGPPWGSTSYIYGRYKRYGSTQVDESFFPIIYATPESKKERTPWVDGYISQE